MAVKDPIYELSLCPVLEVPSPLVYLALDPASPGINPFSSILKLQPYYVIKLQGL